MAMPPDGSSSWVKHDDVWELSSDGARFAMVIVAVNGSSAAITVPVAGSAFDSVYAVHFARVGDDVAVKCGDDAEGIVWRQGVEVALDTAVAGLRVGASGSIELVDGQGRLRIVVSRGSDAGTQISACGGALGIELIEHPGTTIRHLESSMP